MNPWIVALTVMLPTLIEIVDTSVVNVSLNNIAGSLSAGIDESTWVISSYLVSNAVIIPMTGWLSRRFGRKRYLIFSVILFTFSSFMCGSSRSLEMLILFRIFQGIGGGGLQPISQAILLESFPPKQHGMAMAIFGVGIMFGPIIGPLLGGWITDSWSWHWIFYINIPIGLVSIFMAKVFIVDPPYMKHTKMKVDYWGLSLLVIGLGALQVVLDKGHREDWFASKFIFYLTMIAVFALALFVVVELLSDHPIVNLRVFKNLSFTSGNLIMFFAFFTLFGSIVLLPIYVQTLMGYTPYLAGVVLGPGGIASMVAMLIAGKLVTKMNPKAILAAGIIISAYAVNLMSRFSLAADFNFIFFPRVVLGLGLGFLFIPLTTLTMSEIKREDMGNASSVFNLLRNLGGGFGVAFVTTMLSHRTQLHQVHLTEALTQFDRSFQCALPGFSRTLQTKGLGSSGTVMGVIYQQIIRQASMLSFNDVFYVLSIMMIGILPLLLLMKTGKTGGPAQGMH